MKRLHAHPALRNRRGAYTLIELAVSLLAAGILLVGMGSAVLLAARASDPSVGAYQASRQTAETLAEMNRELAYAVAINPLSSSATRIECTVPDLNGDAANDVVAYSWSGVAGAPLQRSLNAGLPATVLDRVNDFQLRYDRVLNSPAANDSAENKWVDQASAGSTATFDVQAGDSIGIYFLPTLPPIATAWKIKRVEIRARQSSTPDGMLRARVWTANASMLPGTLLEEIAVSESSLPTSTGAYQIALPGTRTLTPGQGACITFEKDSGTGVVARLEYGTSSTSSPNTRKLTTWFGGLLWTSQSTEDLHIRIWGVYCTTPDAGTQTFLYTSVGVRLQVGTDVNATFHQGIRLINTPESTGP